LLIASVVATAFAFAGGAVRVSIAGIHAERSTWLGWFAVFAFSLTLIDLVVDRRGAAGAHGDAVRQLAALKSQYRTPPAPGHEVQECQRLAERYQTVMDALPPIPERLFCTLKARHLRKVEISRYISAHPGISARQAARVVKKATK
jgi:hypothetical protein